MPIITARTVEALALLPQRREAQARFAERIAAHLDEPDPASGETARILPAQAATGVGKTLGYLLPLALNAALTGERAVVATHSRALMAQILDHDAVTALDVVERTVGKRPTVASRLGRRNFIDGGRLRALIAESGDGARGRLTEFLDWLETDGCSGLLVEALDEAGLALPPDVTAADICPLPGARSAHYDAHRAAAKEADIVVTSHATLLADARCWGQVLAGDRPARIAVIDEADALGAAARSAMDVRIGLDTMERLNIVLPPGTVGALRDAATRTRLVGPGDAVLIDAVGAIIEAGAKPGLSPQDAADARDVLADLRAWRQAARNEEMRISAYIEGGRRNAALRVVHLDPAMVLARLWRPPMGGGDPMLRSVALISATLTLDDDAGPFLRGVGANPAWTRVEPLARFEPRTFGEVSFVLADRQAPDPSITGPNGVPETNPEWLDYVADGIRDARGNGQRTLVLTTSYADAEALAERVPGAVAHRRGERIVEALEPFRAAPGTCLITPAAWAGVDLPGLKLNVVIPRIPFPAPDDAETAAFTRRFVERGRTEQEARGVLFAMTRDDAGRRLAQGIGRGIRRPDDIARIYILDPRMPISDARVRATFGTTQGKAAGHAALARAVPRRFRTGPGNAWDKARILPLKAAAPAHGVAKRTAR